MRRQIIQWGFDETTIDGHEVLNQWAMLMESSEGDDEKEGATTIVTLECVKDIERESKTMMR